MNTLVSWYPGDHVALTIVETFGVVTILLVSAVVADTFVARQRGAWRCAIWQTALIGVILTPLLVNFAGLLPWRFSLATLATSQSAQIAAAPAQEMPASHQVHSDSITLTELRPEPQVKGTLEPTDSNSSERNNPFQAGTNLGVVDTIPPPLPVAEESPKEGEVASATLNPLHAVATLLICVWASGSIYLTLRMLHGWRKVRALCRHMSSLDLARWNDVLESAARILSSTRRPEVYVCSWTHSPMVVGVLRPRVVLPERLVEISSANQMHDILVHEYAHIVRRDPWTNLLQYLGLILFWVHPLMHLLNRRLDQAREEVCDNHVLEHTERLVTQRRFLAWLRPVTPFPGSKEVSLCCRDIKTSNGV